MNEYSIFTTEFIQVITVNIYMILFDNVILIKYEMWKRLTDQILEWKHANGFFK